MALWPDREDGVEERWLRFQLHVDMSGPDEEENLALMEVNANISFLTSSWACIFGNGCPSIMVSGVRPDTGCCQIGVNFSETHDGFDASVDFERVSKAAAQLTADDCDNMRDVIDGKWYRVDSTGAPTHTRVKDGACVFANRANGAAGKPGCALHVLAKRLGVHPSETKPAICWQVPFGIDVTYDEKEDIYYALVDCTRPGTWGYEHSDSPRHIGWFCTVAPEAYETGAEMVYKTAEVELRKMLGDYVYEELRDRIDEMLKNKELIAKPPALQVDKRIPEFITDRIEVWTEDADDPDSKTRRVSKSALRNTDRKYVESMGGE